ncbi:MAG: IS66 family insertion sequence element accessory protein TnpB [Gammaproteobacteria bacterium]|nr:IS66 family insertion sequence element accessory protein TnpB [Gammaproteobacteria bacterium]
MFRPTNGLPDVYLCLEPQDFRKGILGLSLVVQNRLSLNPMNGQLFVFRNKGRSKVKVLFWERNGFCLWQKQLESDKFHWPKPGTISATITGQQLNWLLDGYNLSLMKPHPERVYSLAM